MKVINVCSVLLTCCFWDYLLLLRVAALPRQSLHFTCAQHLTSEGSVPLLISHVAQLCSILIVNKQISPSYDLSCVFLLYLIVCVQPRLCLGCQRMRYSYSMRWSFAKFMSNGSPLSTNVKWTDVIGRDSWDWVLSCVNSKEKMPPQGGGVNRTP